MNNKQINTTIEEACGWKPTTDGGICWDCNGDPIVTPPDYCNDLNAMHEAEKALGDRLALYREFLRLVVTDDPTNRYNESAFATARQRAEAFLRALGKWEEKKSDFS